MIDTVPGVLILDRTSDWDHHRTVLTLAGTQQAMEEAAVCLAAEAMRSIDLNNHRGVHPRIGALDVLPFVPLGASTMDDCVALAHRTGQRIYEELALPVYFYGAAAKRPERKALENVRRGQFEGLLEEAIHDRAKAPDLGGPALHPTAGAVAVGARKILIAYNINLRTNRLDVAKAIARQVRASSGGLPEVKALGLPLESRGLVQVSINLTDFEKTPLDVVYRTVERLAASHGVEIEESELIGLVPQKALEMASAHSVKLTGFNASDVLEERIRSRAFRTVKLPGPFLAGEKLC